MKFTDKQKEDITNKALGTPEGRTVLAQAMVAPIIKALNSVDFNKKLFFEEDKIYKINKYVDIFSDGKERFDILDL